MSPRIEGPIPEHVKPLMSPEDRRQFGKSARTWEEAEAARFAISEKELQKQIFLYLRMREIPFVNSRMDRRPTIQCGAADFVACFKGRCIAVECKVGGNTLSDEQEAFKRQILANGGIHLICSNLGQVKAVLDSLEIDA